MRHTAGSHDNSLRCSFCGQSQEKAGKLIASPGDRPRAYICDECVAVCEAIIEDDKLEPGGLPSHPLLITRICHIYSSAVKLTCLLVARTFP